MTSKHHETHKHSGHKPAHKPHEAAKHHVSHKAPTHEEKSTEKFDLATSKKVKMRFDRDMFYNDMDNPIFQAGKVYEIEGTDMIQRWLKRGGILVDSKGHEMEPQMTEERIGGADPAEVQEKAEEVANNVDSSDSKENSKH